MTRRVQPDRYGGVHIADVTRPGAPDAVEAAAGSCAGTGTVAAVHLRGGPAVQLYQVAPGAAAVGAFEHFGSVRDVPGHSHGLAPVVN
jgi:hypothetical protein